MAKRNVIPVDLGKGKDHISVDGDAKAAIKKIAARYGMKEIAIASKIYLWFTRQSDLVQKSVLDMLPEGYEEEIVEAILRKIAADKSKKK